MEEKKLVYETYKKILEKELVPAMGCTEPVAVAFCGAKARELLGTKPEKVRVRVSGNIIKNVKSVIVPNTNGAKGIDTAAAAGILYGDASRGLEVIAGVSPEKSADLKEQMKSMEIRVEALASEHILDMEITVYAGLHSAMVRIQDQHTKIVRMEKDGEVCFLLNETAQEVGEKLDYSLLNIEQIFAFAGEVSIEEMERLLGRQIEYNTAISREGMEKIYGAQVGRILAGQGEDVRTQAKAAAAAASDARMGGCEMPVVINSGSGNQGITTSLPVICYAKHYGKSREEMLRALMMSNLTTLHLKTGIGRLSAYCGAVSAGVGAGAGIAYLMTKDLRTICHTIVNSIAITSGMVCDGAKASCAAKIAMAVEAGILGYDMFMNGSQFYGGDGLVSKGVENTIRNISMLGHEGMLETDRTIIRIMTE